MAGAVVELHGTPGTPAPGVLRLDPRASERVLEDKVKQAAEGPAADKARRRLDAFRAQYMGGQARTEVGKASAAVRAAYARVQVLHDEVVEVLAGPGRAGPAARALYQRFLADLRDLQASGEAVFTLAGWTEENVDYLVNAGSGAVRLQIAALGAEVAAVAAEPDGDDDVEEFQDMAENLQDFQQAVEEAEVAEAEVEAEAEAEEEGPFDAAAFAAVKADFRAAFWDLTGHNVGNNRGWSNVFALPKTATDDPFVMMIFAGVSGAGGQDQVRLHTFGRLVDGEAVYSQRGGANATKIRLEYVVTPGRQSSINWLREYTTIPAGEGKTSDLQKDVAFALQTKQTIFTKGGEPRTPVVRLMMALWIAVAPTVGTSLRKAEEVFQLRSSDIAAAFSASAPGGFATSTLSNQDTDGDFLANMRAQEHDLFLAPGEAFGLGALQTLSAARAAAHTANYGYGNGSDGHYHDDPRHVCRCADGGTPMAAPKARYRRRRRRGDKGTYAAARPGRRPVAAHPPPPGYDGPIEACPCGDHSHDHGHVHGDYVGDDGHHHHHVGTEVDAVINEEGKLVQLQVLDTPGPFAAENAGVAAAAAGVINLSVDDGGAPPVAAAAAVALDVNTPPEAALAALALDVDGGSAQAAAPAAVALDVNPDAAQAAQLLSLEIGGGGAPSEGSSNGSFQVLEV